MQTVQSCCTGFEGVAKTKMCKCTKCGSVRSSVGDNVDIVVLNNVQCKICIVQMCSVKCANVMCAISKVQIESLQCKMCKCKMCNVKYTM